MSLEFFEKLRCSAASVKSPLSCYCEVWAFLVAQIVKNLPAMLETWVRSLGWENPLEEGMATHSSILAWRSHGQRRLVDYSPWGHEESDTTERLNAIRD